MTSGDFRPKGRDLEEQHRMVDALDRVPQGQNTCCPKTEHQVVGEILLSMCNLYPTNVGEKKKNGRLVLKIFLHLTSK